MAIISKSYDDFVECCEIVLPSKLKSVIMEVCVNYVKWLACTNYCIIAKIWVHVLYHETLEKAILETTVTVP